MGGSDVSSGWAWRIIMPALREVFADVMARADGKKTPRTRRLFIVQIDAEMRAHYGLKGDPKMREARQIMNFIEREIAVWGDPEFECTVDAARETLAEIMEDR